MRNATQRGLTTRLGTAGATHVRFLFGLPFALIFLIVVHDRARPAAAAAAAVFWAWVIAGALTQIAATALMLAAMNDRSFVVVYAYIKTEPVQVAVFGLVFLGDLVTPAMAAAILIATAGVVIMALKPGTSSDFKATLLGLGAGAMFALSAVGFRGAILSLGLPSYVLAATFTVAVGLLVQAALLRSIFGCAIRGVLIAILRPGDRPCSRVSWARWRRSSGFLPLRSPRPPACARWRWSKCCSRRQSRALSSSSRRLAAKHSASC